MSRTPAKSSSFGSSKKFESGDAKCMSDTLRMDQFSFIFLATTRCKPTPDHGAAKQGGDKFYRNSCLYCNIVVKPKALTTKCVTPPQPQGMKKHHRPRRTERTSSNDRVGPVKEYSCASWVLNRLVDASTCENRFRAFERTSLVTRNRSQNRTRPRPRTRILFRKWNNGIDLSLLDASAQSSGITSCCTASISSPKARPSVRRCRPPKVSVTPRTSVSWGENVVEKVP